MSTKYAKSRNQGLQALRGVAAMLVFIHHLPWLTNNVTGGNSVIQKLALGGFGVSIFLALSGYLMVHKVSLRSPFKFIEARARRIYPALWLAVLLSAALLWITGANFSLPWEALTLWPAGYQSSTTVPYWTLLYEMAFYAAVFLCLIVAGKHAIILLMVVLLASYGLAQRPYVWSEIAFANWHQLLFSALSVYFLVGICVGWLPRIQRHWLAAATAVVGTIIYCLDPIGSLSGIAAIGEPTIFSDKGALPHILRAFGCALIVWASISWAANGQISSLLARLGDYSYGIYLVHIAGMFFGAYIARQLAMQEFPYYIVMIFIAAVSLPISVAFGWLDWKMQRWLRPASQFIRKNSPALTSAETSH